MHKQCDVFTDGIKLRGTGWRGTREDNVVNHFSGIGCQLLGLCPLYNLNTSGAESASLQQLLPQNTELRRGTVE